MKELPISTTINNLVAASGMCARGAELHGFMDADKMKGPNAELMMRYHEAEVALDTAIQCLREVERLNEHTQSS